MTIKLETVAIRELANMESKMNELSTKITLAISSSVEGLSYCDVAVITAKVMQVLEENSTKSDTLYRVTSDKSAAVSPDVYWQPMQTAPIGVKAQLHTKAGVAVYSTYTPIQRNSFIGWCPCPKRPDWLKAMLSPYYNHPAL